MKYKISLLLMLLLSPSLLLSGEVYRTVDESGQVTFTDAPNAEQTDAERMALPPSPSAERVKDAEARNRELQRAVDKAKGKRERQSGKRESKVGEAERALAEAEAELAAAKEIKDDDRQTLAGRGRRIRPEYFERIKEAEAAVEAARKQLQRARIGR